MSEAGVRLGLMLLQQANASMPEAASEAPVEDDALIEPHEGRGSKFWDVFFCLLPILLLVMTTVWRRVQMSTSTSLPLAAVLLWIIRLAYLKLDANFTNAAVIYGLLDALKPLTIVTGAICLFQTMEVTMCLPWIISRVRSLSSGHPVAEVFLIGWAFAYMIEGCSGFGTPVALAAPMLVSLGHPPVESICCCLIMNTLATVFGSVGFPVWFGFAGLDGIDDKDLRQVGLRAEVALFVCAHVVPVMAALFLVRWQDLKESWKFVLLSIWAAKVPAVALAYVSTDFSSLIGGMVALGVIGVMAKFNFGLNPEPGRKHPDENLAEVSKHLGSIYDPSRHPRDPNRSYRSGAPRSDIFGERSTHSVADPSIRSGTNGAAALAQADGNSPPATRLGGGSPQKGGFNLRGGSFRGSDNGMSPPGPAMRSTSPPMGPMRGVSPPVSGTSGLDGESIGPSASEVNQGGAENETVATSDSRMSPSAAPSQASSTMHASQVTKSFNNRNNQNTYTYRVAPRHGRTAAYARDSVQSYSSSAVPGGGGNGPHRGRVGSTIASDFTLDSRTAASSSPNRSLSPPSPNMRSASPRHRDNNGNARMSPKMASPARYGDQGAARPSVGPWAAGQQPRLAPTANRVAQDFTSGGRGARGSSPPPPTSSESGNPLSSQRTDLGDSPPNATAPAADRATSGGGGGYTAGYTAGAPGGGYPGVGLGSSSMNIWPRSRASGASSLSLSGGHARVVSGPLTPHMEVDEANFTEESIRDEYSGKRISGGAGGSPAASSGLKNSSSSGLRNATSGAQKASNSGDVKHSTSGGDGSGGVGGGGGSGSSPGQTRALRVTETDRSAPSPPQKADTFQHAQARGSSPHAQRARRPSSSPKHRSAAAGRDRRSSGAGGLVHESHAYDRGSNASGTVSPMSSTGGGAVFGITPPPAPRHESPPAAKQDRGAARSGGLSGAMSPTAGGGHSAGRRRVPRGVAESNLFTTTHYNPTNIDTANATDDQDMEFLHAWLPTHGGDASAVWMPDSNEGAVALNPRAGGPVAEAEMGMGMGPGPEAAGFYRQRSRARSLVNSDYGAAADGRSFGGNSVVSDKESVTLRLSPAPMLGNDSLHLRAHNASLHSSPYVALDGASDDGKSGIVLTTAYGSSVHGGVRGLGLGDMKEDDVDVDALDPEWGAGKQMVLRTLPIWLTVLLLLITRIEPIGLREVLNDPDPNFDIDLGYLFKFELSASLVVRISDFLGLDGGEGRLGPLAWKYELLYIPFLLPFVASSIVTLAVFHKSIPNGKSVFFPFKESVRRASKIAMALFGSLVLVSLLRNAETPGSAPAYIIGHNLAGAFKTGFVVCSAVLGALGSFFSGSTTVSNLTFGIVQQVAARKIGRSETALLALQAVGATAGNMICINNIISARTVVGGRALHVSEGAFIMKTAPALGAMLVIGTLMALPFIFA